MPDHQCLVTPEEDFCQKNPHIRGMHINPTLVGDCAPSMRVCKQLLWEIDVVLFAWPGLIVHKLFL